MHILTQNIVSVFGVSGVEGLFRLSCEHTLSVMRDHRETLLTLLEAFVYDPLVDWTPGLAGGGLAGAMYGGGLGQEETEKREMEHSLTFSMLGVRVAEMKGAWLDNQHDLQAALLQVEEGLATWQELEAVSLGNGERLAALHRYMSILKEAEVNPGHRLYTILDTYRKQKAVEGGVEVVKTQVTTFIGECDKIMSLYNRAATSVSGPQLAKWDADVGRLAEANQVVSCRTVSTFLENAGQRELLAQYETMEKDMRSRLTSLLEELKRIMADLALYNTVTSLYPSQGRDQHRIHKYSAWGNRLIADKEGFRVDVVDAILGEFTVLFAPHESAGPERVEQVRLMNAALEKEQQESVTALQRLYQRMMSENLMKPGRAGVLEEMARNRDMMLNQLNHPDSGVKHANLICYFLNLVVPIVDKWMELEKSLAEDREGPSQRTDVMIEGIIMQAGLANSILNTMELLNLGSRSAHVGVIEAFFQVASALRSLETSFSSIILPEAVKKHLQAEASVLEVSRSVFSIIASGGISLEEVKHELRLHTRCVMLGMDSPHTAAVKLVHAMKNSWTKLISVASVAEDMSTGQMLLCALTTLLDKVDNAMLKLRESVLNVPVTQDFNSLRIVQACQEIGGPAFNPTPGVWECQEMIIFISKLEFLEQFFVGCKTFAGVLSLNEIGVLLPVGSALLRPVKAFCHDYVKGLLVGTGSRHLACAIAHFARDSCPGVTARFFGSGAAGGTRLEVGDLCQLVHDDRVNSGALNQARISKCTMLTKNLLTAVSRWAMIQQLDAAIEVTNARQQLHSLLHSTVQWYYQELLPPGCKLAEPSRAKFLPGITGMAARVYSLEAELSNVMVELIDLRNIVDQRLRWAVGANPQLQDVLDRFDTQHANQLENARQAGGLVRAVTGIVEAAVQYELLRTKTPEATASDHQFLNILTMARESAALRQMQESSGLTEQEMLLLDMNPPTGPIDRFWIRQTEETIASTVRSIQDQVVGNNKHCGLALRRLTDSASLIKDLLTVHHRLMADVAVLLRTILKIDNLEFPGIAVYLARYKEYTEQLNNLVRTLGSDNLSTDLAKISMDTLDSLKQNTGSIYGELVNIAAIARDENLVQELLKNRKMKEDENRKEDNETDERSAAKKVGGSQEMRVTTYIHIFFC